MALSGRAADGTILAEFASPAYVSDRLVGASVDTVVLTPLPDKGLEEIDVFARHFLI